MSRKKLIICTALFSMATVIYAQTNQPKIYAMVVGISHYIDGNIPNLKFAEKDAEAFAAFLKSPQAGAIPVQNISLLTNEKATRSNILRELVQLVSRSGPEDLFIFYFSGHGKNDILENSGYLLTYDTENDNEAGTAISMDDINSKIGRSKAKMKASYIDACHAGLFKSSGTKGTAADNGEISNAYLAALANAPDGNVAFMASTARQQSLEDEKLGHGVFTYYLIKGLQGEADLEQTNASGYNNGVITISEMQTYLTRKIEEATKYKQKPNVEGNFDGDFPLSVTKSGISFAGEITKRPKKDTKKNEAANPIVMNEYKTPDDELLPNGMALADRLCYGQYAFINMTTASLTLYKIRTRNASAVIYGGRYDTDIKISAGAKGSTPRLYVFQAPWANSIDMCNDLFDDYNFYFKKTENGKTYYGQINVTVESRKRKYLVLSDANLNFSDKEPVIN